MIHKPHEDDTAPITDNVVRYHVERSNRGPYPWSMVQTFESGRTRVVKRYISRGKAEREAAHLQTVLDMVRKLSEDSS